MRQLQESRSTSAGTCRLDPRREPELVDEVVDLREAAPIISRYRGAGSSSAP